MGRFDQLQRDGAPLAAGYAATSTDTGHTGGQAATFINHPEKVIDFAYRAVHEMAVAGEGHHRGVLRRWPEAFVLPGLFDGRTPGAHRRAALSTAISTASSPARRRSMRRGMHGTQVWSAQQANRDDASLIPNMPQQVRRCFTMPC